MKWSTVNEYPASTRHAVSYLPYKCHRTIQSVKEIPESDCVLSPVPAVKS